MKWLFFFLSLVLTSGLFSYDAYGCSCAPKMATGQTPAEVKAERKNFYVNEYKGSLFIGKVEKIEIVLGTGIWEGGTERKLTVRVEKYWLKDPSGMMVIRTGMNDGDCGIQFETGKTYLFKPRYFSGALRSGLCDYLTEGDYKPDGESAKELIEILGKPKLKN